MSTLTARCVRCVVPGGFKPQFFPNLQGIMRLFSRPITAASLLVHLLSINLFVARSLYLAGAICLAPS